MFRRRKSRPSAYLFRDDFIQDNTNLLTSSAMVPGPGVRQITGTRLKVINRRLRGGNQTSSPGWSNDRYVGPAQVRQPRLTLIVRVAINDAGSGIAMGWATSDTPGDPLLEELVWHSYAGQLDAIINGSRRVVGANQRNIRPIDYLAVFVTGTTGGAILLSTFEEDAGHGFGSAIPIAKFPQATVILADGQGSTGILHPFVNYYSDTGGYVNGHALHTVRGLLARGWPQTNWPPATVADTFDGTSTTTPSSLTPQPWTVLPGWVFGRNAGRLYTVSGSGFGYLWRDVGAADGWVTAVFTTPAVLTSKGWGFYLRGESSTKFMRAWNDFGNTFKIQKWNNGYQGQAAGSGFTWAASTTYVVTVAFYKKYYRAWINGVDVFGAWQTDPDTNANDFITGTLAGFYVANPGTDLYMDDFRFTPAIVTLPPEVQAGVGPQLLTAGALLAEDLFDGSGDLTAHTPNTGPAWLARRGAATVSGGAMVPTLNSASGILLYTQNLGVKNVEYYVKMQTSAGAGFVNEQIRFGILGRYSNLNNHIVIRFFMDPSQPLSDELELVETRDGGTSTIEHKVNIGDAFQPGGIYEMRVQFWQDLVQVLMWDGTAWRPRITYYTIIDQPGTEFGIYSESVDNGCVALEIRAYALGG